jgi:HAD superfamily hydrolase (TIGR01549 family)
MTDVNAPTDDRRAFRQTDWPNIKLVVFDVDGTLYDQRPVRLAMAGQLAWHAIRTGTFRHARSLAAFRGCREEAGTREIPDGFEAIVLEEAARSSGYDPQDLAELVEEWIERRPLQQVARARAAAVEVLVERLRASGRRIGVWSDYPAVEKLAALGLVADFVVSATDDGVKRLKPQPHGLLAIMDRAKVQASETLMIGDRLDRDGEAAFRAGASLLLRSKRTAPNVATFRRFDDPVFRPILSAHA